MTNAKGASLLFLGVLIIVVGWLVQSGIVEWILDVIGYILIVSGILAAVVGLFQMISGGGRRSRY
ncbi:MAG: hypothetical protein C1O27_001265 [Chloroflexi bacterium]|jgi:hypothetical protein|nr:MAG: hypothetical protein C1O27_001265 [Chloroflexota bacterium]